MCIAELSLSYIAACIVFHQEKVYFCLALSAGRFIELFRSFIRKKKNRLYGIPLKDLSITEKYITRSRLANNAPVTSTCFEEEWDRKLL
jgi:hypothetical protein